MRKRVIFVLCCSISLLSACSMKLKEADLVAEAGTAGEVMYNPVPLEEAKKVLPFSFHAPSFLPYQYAEDVQAVIRKGEKGGKQNIVLNIKYDRPDGRQNGYVELTVANFEYSMQLVKQRLFDEELKLENGTEVYFKEAGDGGNEFASLTWQQGSMDYQLLYRNVTEKEAVAVKQELLQIANSMDA